MSCSAMFNIDSNLSLVQFGGRNLKIPVLCEVSLTNDQNIELEVVQCFVTLIKMHCLVVCIVCFDLIE